MVRHHNKDVVSEVSLLKAASLDTSDLYCAYCNYIGNISVDVNWPTYKNPNFDLIVRAHKPYLKWIDLCPRAIEYVLKEYIYFCCPKCSKTRLHISSNSTFHPEWIRSSLNCHNAA